MTMAICTRQRAADPACRGGRNCGSGLRSSWQYRENQRVSLHMAAQAQDRDRDTLDEDHLRVDEPLLRHG